MKRPKPEGQPVPELAGHFAFWPKSMENLRCPVYSSLAGQFPKCPVC